MWRPVQLACILLATTVLGAAANPLTRDTCTVSPASPAPQGAYCNRQGNVLSGACIGTSAMATQTACRDKCLSNSACVSFSYAAKSKTCKQYKKKVKDSRFEGCKSGTYFWDRGCYKKTCQDTCAAGLTKCGTSGCVDLQTSKDNCGSCFNKCATAEVCLNGGCACAADPTSNHPRTLCDGQCSDLSTDENHCGSCSTKCASDETCTPDGENLDCGTTGCCYCDGPVTYNVTRDPPASYVRTYSGRGHVWSFNNFQAFSDFSGTEERACDVIEQCATLFIDNSFPHINLYWAKDLNMWRCVHSMNAAAPDNTLDSAGASLIYAPAS